MDKPRRRVSPWKWAIIAVLATVGTGTGILCLAEAAADAEVARESNLLRALGYAVTVAEYEARRPKDPALDAAPLYIEADKIITENPQLNLVRVGPVAALSPERVERFVRGSNRAYDRIRAASYLPFCTQKKPWELESASDFTFPTEHLVYPCLVYARWKSEHGDWQGALSDLSMGRRVGAHVQPKNGVGKIGAAMAEIESLQVFGMIVSRHRRQAEVLRAARQWLDALPPPPLRHHFYEDDMIFNRHLLQHPTHMGDAGQSAAKSSSERWFARLALGTSIGRKQVEARFLRLMRERLVPVPKDNWEDHRREVIIMQRLDSEPSLLGRIAGELINDYRWGERTPNTAAWTTRRMADVALWVLEQAHTTGKFPSQLPHSEPRCIDPWTGEPYRIIVNGSGFTIRSIGGNKQDEGGPMAETRVNSDDEELVVPPVSR